MLARTQTLDVYAQMQQHAKRDNGTCFQRKNPKPPRCRPYTSGRNFSVRKPRDDGGASRGRRLMQVSCSAAGRDDYEVEGLAVVNLKVLHLGERCAHSSSHHRSRHPWERHLAADREAG